METTLVNDWITLPDPHTINGAPVQVKYAGLDTLCDENNVVLYTYCKYWQRELYPNGQPIRTYLRSYKLEDLERKEWEDTPAVYDEAGVLVTPAVIKYMNERLVLTGFVNTLGNPYIIAPLRATIADKTILPLNHEEAYPLHRDTRTINTL
jgi:hypothetical protein